MQPRRTKATSAKRSRLSAAALAVLALPLLAGVAAQHSAQSPLPSSSSSPQPVSTAAPAPAGPGHHASTKEPIAFLKIAVVGTGAAAPAAASAADAHASSAEDSVAAKKKLGEETSSSPASSTSSSSPSSSASSSSTVCPSIAPSPTRHVVLVVKGATYVLPDDGGKGSEALPPRLLEGMLAVNGSVLGPTLEFEEGDDVSVDVVNDVAAPGNSSSSESGSTPATSVHWHGLDLPGAAWADGVTGITQRAALRGVTFRYRFKAGPVGTHWYHAREWIPFLFPRFCSFLLFVLASPFVLAPPCARVKSQKNPKKTRT